MRCRVWLPVLFVIGSIASAVEVGQPSFVAQSPILLALDLASSATVVADLDGDGKPDFIVATADGPSGAGNASLLVVGANSTGSIVVKQRIAFDDDVEYTKVATLTEDDGVHVFVAGAPSGAVHELTGWPLVEVNTVQTGLRLNAMTVADLYGDGNVEILVLTSDTLYALSAKSGQPLWMYPTGGSSVGVAQLDGTGRLNIVVDSGVVLDALTLTTDWNYTSGFGYELVVGAFGANGAAQFASIDPPGFTVYGSDPWEAKWSAGTNIGSISAARFGNDEDDSVVAGDDTLHAIRVFNAQTHQQSTQLMDTTWSIGAVSAADLTGTGAPDFSICATSNITQSPLVRVVDGQSAQTLWSFTAQDGAPFSSVAVGDVNNDGHDELIVASTPGLSYYPPGGVRIFDDQTGDLQWQSPPTSLDASDPFYMQINRVLLSKQASGVSDIVLAGTTLYDGKITVLSGVDYSVKLEIYNYASGPMVDFSVRDAALVDFDGDGVDDIVTALQPDFGNGAGAVLKVFSGVDGHLLWTSPEFSSPIASVFVTPDAPRELIAVLEQNTQAFDVATGAPTWSLQATSSGGLYVPNGVNGPELLLFQQSGAVFVYDATTRGFLRSFLLPSPLLALSSLDGTSALLIGSAGKRLVTASGVDGHLFDETHVLGDNLALNNHIALKSTGPSQWTVAAGNNVGAFRFSVVPLPDDVFDNGFETTP